MGSERFEPIGKEIVRVDQPGSADNLPAVRNDVGLPEVFRDSALLLHRTIHEGTIPERLAKFVAVGTALYYLPWFALYCEIYIIDMTGILVPYVTLINISMDFMILSALWSIYLLYKVVQEYRKLP